MILPKLVRDKIPKIIEDSGKTADKYTATGKDLDRFLIRKIVEEVSEFEETPCLEEAADVYEVFLAILDNWKLDLSDVKNTAQIKKELRGAFQKGIILKQVHGTNNN